MHKPNTNLRERFLPKNSPNSQSGSYLIVGFDTEYQREALENPDGQIELRNEVLSYQYSCRVVTPNNDGEEPKWSGIVLPKGRRDCDRLTLHDFLQNAISAGFRAHPDVVMPSDIYLVAHFTRADVPGFSDFKDSTGREALNLENIRNVFMNVKRDISFDLKVGAGGGSVPLRVKIRDTIALAPGGAKSLAALGEILGFNKLKLSEDPVEELHVKKNMAEFMESNWRLFRDYAIRDAEVCALYTVKMMRLYQEKTGKFRLPVTLTSIGVDLIQDHWKSRGYDPLAVVGKERVKEKYWSRKHKQNRIVRKTVSVKKLFWSEDFFTECYHGGRNEQFWFGPAPEGIWYDYDLTSAYPSAMALIGMPDWSSIREIRDTNELLYELSPLDFAYANVDFEFPENVRYPVLPVRTESGLLFPRKGNSTTHISEIALARNLGCKIELVEGKRIDGQISSNPFLGEAPPERVFEGFARTCIDERSKHPKKTLNNLFWKELVNSTYGKTAQGLRERRIYDLRDAETKPLEPSKITNPVYAAFITAFCRGVLGEIMNALPQSVQIFSVTTDGFLTTATDEQMRAASGETLGFFYAASRKLLSDEKDVASPPPKIYEVKHIIRQPIGWRTRGQATLKHSEIEDWAETDIEPKDDDRIVLAKAGIKFDGIFSKQEQNEEIIRLFLDRRPTDTMTVTQGAGIREMYEQGMDFVDKELTKRLSMEFDWKRKPDMASDFNIANGDDEHCQHLAFSTGPWHSVEQFNTVRSIWEDYNRDTNHCLKTEEDYQVFAEFFEAKLAAQGPAGAYLAKTDGVLKRLRRDLVIAHWRRKAGTHELKPKAFGREKFFPTYKLTAKELAEILSEELGIPCTKFDVDNARKKKVFAPHQVPRTQESRLVFWKLKRELFPKLEIDQFLTGKAEFTLDTQPFATA